MFIPLHGSPPVARYRHTPRQKTALGGIKRLVADVPHVNLPEQRIGLTHSLQTATAPTQNATLRPTPHQLPKLNARLIAVSIAIKTSSRSPPRIWFGRFADWWITISRGLSVVCMVYTTAALTPKALDKQRSREHQH